MRPIDADALIEAIEKRCGVEFKFAKILSPLLEEIDNAPTVPQVTVFTEDADEKAVEDLKAELQSIIDARPQGEWIKHIDDLFPEDSSEECPFCHEEQRLVGNDDNFCPNCGAKLKMPY